MGLKSVVLRRRAPQPGGSYARRTEGPRRKEKRDADEGLRRNDTVRTKTHYGRSDAMNYFGIEREAKERQEGLLREAQGRRLALEARAAGTEQTSEKGANTMVQVTGTRLSRIGGLLVFVGAVVFVLHVVWRSVLTAGVDPLVWAQADLWVPLNALGALGAALVLLGMPAIYARIAPQGGLPSLVGFALIGVSWTFFGLILSLYGALVLPWLAEQAPRLFTGSSPTPLGFVVAFALGLLAWLVGAVLLAVPFVRGRVRPRWVGYVLPASALWVLVGSFVIAPGGPAGNPAVNLLSNLGPVLLLIGLGYLGFRAWTERARPGTSGRVPYDRENTLLSGGLRWVCSDGSMMVDVPT